MNRLTSRDRVLLVVLLVVVAIFGFYRFVYQPLNVSVDENKVILEDYNQQRAEMMSIIARYGTQDETISALQDNINSKLESVSEYRSNEDLEDYVLAMTEDFDLDVMTVTIADYQMVQMDPIIDEDSMTPMIVAENEDGEEVTTYIMKDYVCEFNDCDDGVYVDSAIPSVMMEKNTITVELEGDEDDYKELLDVIEADQKSMVLVYSSENLADEGGNYFILTLDVYSIKGW